MDQRERLQNCYFVKNVLMILVVAYHSIALWMPQGWFVSPVVASNILGIVALWLNSFHIYGFVLVSGYIYYYMRYEKTSKEYMNYGDFIKNKAKRLLVPYGFVCLFWVMPIYSYFYKPDTNVLIKKYILMESPSQLWFLIMLFGCSIVFYLLSDYVRAHPIAGGIIMVLIYGAGIIGDQVMDNYFQIWNICKYLLFFYIGFEFRQYGFKCFEKIPSGIYILVDIVLFGVWRLCGQSNVVHIRILSVGFLFFLQVVGSIGVFIILQKIAAAKKENRMGTFLSKHNMTIYLFHQQLIYFVVVWGNGKVNNYILAGMNFVISFAGALFISILLNKNIYTRFLISGKIF